MSVAYGKGPKGKATKLHSQVVRARGACENCGEREYARLTCAHIVGRRFAATRTDENNAFCLCYRCHFHFTDWPLEFSAFVVSKIGQDAYDALKHKAEAGVKTNDAFWLAECLRLTELLKEVA